MFGWWCESCFGNFFSWWVVPHHVIERHYFQQDLRWYVTLSILFRITAWLNDWKSGPLRYKEELTSYHVWICKFLTCGVSKRNMKDFFYTSKCLVDDVKVALAIFFLVSCTTPCYWVTYYWLMMWTRQGKKLPKQLSHHQPNI